MFVLENQQSCVSTTQWKIQDTNATTVLYILIFDTVIKHSIDTHSGNTLKCRRPLIHPSKGTFVFQTKDFEVIPKDVINSGKKIIINQERESVTLKAEL